MAILGTPHRDASGARRVHARFTFDPAADIWPVWSPDGQTVYFASNRKGNYGIYKKSLEGAGEVEEVIRTQGEFYSTGVSPDGSQLMVFGPVDGAGTDLFVVALDGSADLQPWRPAEFNEADVRNFVRDHVAQYKVPREVRVLDELPRNPTGKILRRELKV